MPNIKQQKLWPGLVALAFAVGTMMFFSTPNMENGGMLLMLLFFILFYVYKTVLDYLIQAVNNRDKQ